MSQKMRLLRNNTLARFYGIWLAMLLIMLLPASAQGQEVTDELVNIAVLEAFINDDAIAGHFIDIDVMQGVVTLSGRVDNLLVKERAAQLAKTIKGVRTVINRITVTVVVERSDEQIREDINKALLYDPATEAFEVKVAVKNGSVTLSGTVDSFHEGKLASLTAMGVGGVVEVINNLNYSSRKERPDNEIKAEIEQRLKWSVWVNDEAVDVSVADGKVILSGVVGSVLESDKAIDMAWANGVREVDHGNLKVDWEKGTEMRRQMKPFFVSDKDIEEAIELAYIYDPRLLSYNPNVSVKNRVVYLTGKVSSLRAKQAAEQVARDTVGVMRVKNYLAVRPIEQVTFQGLEENIEDALKKNIYVSEDQVSVNVINGRAFLSGAVESHYEKQQAEDTTAGQHGVVEVINNIHVLRPPLSKNDFDLLQDIRAELFWSPFVDEEQVKVSVEGGTAYLSGKVGSPMEKEIAEENAWEAGAKMVINLLEVKIPQP